MVWLLPTHHWISLKWQHWNFQRSATTNCKYLELIFIQKSYEDRLSELKLSTLSSRWLGQLGTFSKKVQPRFARYLSPNPSTHHMGVRRRAAYLVPRARTEFKSSPICAILRNLNGETAYFAYFRHPSFAFSLKLQIKLNILLTNYYLPYFVLTYSSFHTTHQGCVIPSTKGYSVMYVIFINVIDSLYIIHPNTEPIPLLMSQVIGLWEKLLLNKVEHEKNLWPGESVSFVYEDRQR